MKLSVYITTMLVIFQVSQSLGQDFAPIGAEWYYGSSAGGLAPTGSEYYYLLSEKDTVINDYDLRKIKRIYCNYQGDSLEVAPYFIYQSGDSVSLYNDNDDSLYRLFVFNVSQGDTLTLDVPWDSYNSGDPTYRVVIDTIVSETYDGVELNKYVLEQIDHFGWFNEFYLDKVGGYEWFVPHGMGIIPEADGPIRCYHDDEIEINFLSQDCEYRMTVNSINDLSPDSFELSPNPTSDFIQIKSDSRIKKVEVIDNTGKIILETDKTLINIKSFKNGVYFIRIYSGTHTITKKVLKN